MGRGPGLIAVCTRSISPVDRIATRMGAYDAIFSGRSTFAVEMDEVR